MWSDPKIGVGYSETAAHYSASVRFTPRACHGLEIEGDRLHPDFPAYTAPPPGPHNYFETPSSSARAWSIWSYA